MLTVRDVPMIIDVIKQVREVRALFGVPPSIKTPLYVVDANPHQMEALVEFLPQIKAMCGVSELVVDPALC